MSLLCFLAFSLYKKIESVELERSNNVQLKRQRVVDVLIETRPWVLPHTSALLHQHRAPYWNCRGLGTGDCQLIQNYVQCAQCVTCISLSLIYTGRHYSFLLPNLISHIGEWKKIHGPLQLSQEIWSKVKYAFLSKHPPLFVSWVAHSKISGSSPWY